MARILKLFSFSRSKPSLWQPDPYTDGATPLMCREVMTFGGRFCERPEGHGGAHMCRAGNGAHLTCEAPAHAD